MNVGGLSKRELFAAMAMQGLLSVPPDEEEMEMGFAEMAANVAESAVDYADALIAQLAKEPST